MQQATLSFLSHPASFLMLPSASSHSLATAQVILDTVLPSTNHDKPRACALGPDPSAVLVGPAHKSHASPTRLDAGDTWGFPRSKVACVQGRDANPKPSDSFNIT